MEHVSVVSGARQSGDRIALARILGIPGRGHHDTECHATVPFGLRAIERAGDAVLEQRQQVGLEAHQDRLRLGVAHAAVELERLDRAVGRDHQAGVEKAAERRTLGLHAVDDGLDHLAHHARVDFRRDHRCGRVRAHAARVRTAVAVEQALVVLAGRERQHVAAVDHDDEARFLAFEEVLDDDARAGRAHRVADEHRVDRGVRLGEIHRDDDPFARGESVGLDHDRCAATVDVGVCRSGVGERLVHGRRDVVPDHELLGEVLGGFEPGRALRGSEDLQAGGAEGIDDARGERGLGADDRQRDVLLAGERDEFGDVGDRDVEEAVLAGGAGVAGRDVDTCHLRRLGEAPADRVFATAGADDEEIHDLVAEVWISDGNGARR